MGIEPTQPAWKAGILPLNYARKYNTSCIKTKSPFRKALNQASPREAASYGYWGKQDSNL